MSISQAAPPLPLNADEGLALERLDVSSSVPHRAVAQDKALLFVSDDVGIYEIAPVTLGLSLTNTWNAA